MTNLQPVAPPASIGTLDSLWERRKKAAALHAKGRSVQAIAAAVGLSRPAVYAVLALVEEAQRACRPVAEALRPAPRGRQKGEGRFLSPRREEELRTLLLTRGPRELGIDADVWTRETFMQLIQRRYLLSGEGKTTFKLSERTAGLYLTRWGLTGSIARQLDKKADLQEGETFVSAARLGELTLVWELLAWSLLKTNDLQDLLFAAATTAWDGQTLFHTVARAGALDRRRRHLMANVNKQLATGAANPTDAEQQALMRATRQALNSSSARVAERLRLLGSKTDAPAQHWSIRMLPVKLVDVQMSSSKSGGQVVPAQKVHETPTELLLCLNWTARRWHVERVSADTRRGSTADQQELISRALQNALGTPAQAIKAGVVVHLPSADRRRQGTTRVEAALHRLGIRVERDAPPVFAWPAEVVMERHLVRRRGKQAGSPSFVAGGF